MLRLVLVALCFLSLIGCQSQHQGADSKSETPSGSANRMTVFANSAGQALCPVMHETIFDTSKAPHQDYKGVRYYFCCDGCPQKFAKEPQKYAAKN